jgi:ABC-type phosphate transport system ATPase subunit
LRGDGAGWLRAGRKCCSLPPDWFPFDGKVYIGDHDLDKLTDSTLGREIAYVGGAVHVWTGTIRENLYYGLRHRPLDESPSARREELNGLINGSLTEARLKP